jgi:hypothetical protein
MSEEPHDPLHSVMQLRQTLSADKLAIGFFLGAGCPCSIKSIGSEGQDLGPLIPDVNGLTKRVGSVLEASAECRDIYQKLIRAFSDDEITNPNIEKILNRIRSFREVAGKLGVRDLSLKELSSLDHEICQTIREIVSCSLPTQRTPYHALAAFVGEHRSAFTEIFTTNYDILIEEALEKHRVPYFDGFIGSSRPFFDLRAIEDGEIPERWSRLWKLHGSINWRFNKTTKAVFRSDKSEDGDELLIHPSHLKYDESRRMPYFVMIDRLRNFLRRAERPVALIIAGYSFSDEHINEAIVESLKANASAACFALQFDELNKYPEAISLAKDNANISLFAADKAIIRRREGPWVTSPTTDVAALKNTFKITDYLETVTDKDAVDKPLPCRMLIGDFKSLGYFLDEFSGFHDLEARA